MLNSTGLEKRREPPAQPAHEVAPRILNLPEMVAALSDEDQERFDRIFSVSEVSGALAAPEAMHDWIRGYFGSVEAVANSDLVVAVGTSSVVYPAAGLPELALANGTPVIEVNPEPTPLSKSATLSLRESAV